MNHKTYIIQFSTNFFKINNDQQDAQNIFL